MSDRAGSSVLPSGALAPSTERPRTVKAEMKLVHRGGSAKLRRRLEKLEGHVQQLRGAKLRRRLEKLEAQVQRLRREQKKLGRRYKGAQRAAPRPEPLERPEPLSSHITHGRHSYIGRTTHAIAYPGDHAAVYVGSFCSIADWVEFMVGGNHRVDWVSTYPFRVRLGLPGALCDGHPATKGDITIGHDVWIGRGARILSGVTVGNGAVIGASAVVGSDVRPYAVCVGNPAREVRRRFGDEQIAALERIAWWEWPEERIRAAIPRLTSSDVDRFIADELGL